MSPSQRILFVAAASLLFGTAALAADTAPPPSQTQSQQPGGGMRGFLSPEERMMMMVQSHQAVAGMTDDQKHAYRDQQRTKFMAMSDADKTKLKADLQAKWDALSAAQQQAIQQQIAQWRAAHASDQGGHS